MIHRGTVGESDFVRIYGALPQKPRHFISNKITFIGLRISKNYYKRPGGVVGVYGKGHLGVSYVYVGRCVLREWVVRGGG